MKPKRNGTYCSFHYVYCTLLEITELKKPVGLTHGELCDHNNYLPSLYEVPGTSHQARR